MSPARLPPSRGGRLNSGMNASVGAGGDRWKQPQPVAARSVNGDDYGGGRIGSAPRPGSRQPARSVTPGSSETGMPASRMPKWKRDHMAFQQAVNAGRKLKAAQEAGMPLPPPEPTSDEVDDRVPCPHCGRRFNAMAAERHIPKCSSIMAKPKTLTRGGGGQAVSERPRPGGTAGRGALRGGFGGGREFVL